MMKIAFLGWGSLVWDPRELQIKGGWQRDGPRIPIEFARISRGGRLTLVIRRETAVVQTLWAHACHTELGAARCNLREREKTPRICHIGFIFTHRDDDQNTNILSEKYVKDIRMWALEKGLGAVVWTDLPSNWHDPPTAFQDKVKPPFNRDNVIAYLKSLEGESLSEAEKYIRFAPRQVQTRVRRRIEKELDWQFVPEEERWDYKPEGLPSESISS